MLLESELHFESIRHNVEYSTVDYLFDIVFKKR